MGIADAVAPSPTASRLDRLRARLERLADIGRAPGDSPEERVRKRTLVIASATIAPLAVLWAAIYGAVDRPLSGAIPGAYAVVSTISIVTFARTKRYHLFRTTQLLLMLALPFLLQWSLGGYVASSAVSVWALVAGFGALYLYGPTQGIPWFVAFVVLTIISGVIDPFLEAATTPIPAPIRLVFFVGNIVAVSGVTYALLQHFVRQREQALALSERLLRNVLPESIAERLKEGEKTIAEGHPEVTVLFVDVVDFTPFAERTPPTEVVSRLDRLFTAFDRLVERNGLEKIKTIGDAYMAVAGAPEARPDHVEAVAETALAILDELRGPAWADWRIEVRIGIDTGPVIAGVIGRRKFIYDLWGDTVNTASRMESHGAPGRIHVTAEVERRLRGRYTFDSRGRIAVKGKGPMDTYFLGRRL